MKRLKWALARALCNALGVASAWVIIRFFLEPRPWPQALQAIGQAFATGLAIGFPFYYARFPHRRGKATQEETEQGPEPYKK